MQIYTHTPVQRIKATIFHYNYLYTVGKAHIMLSIFFPFPRTVQHSEIQTMDFNMRTNGNEWESLDLSIDDRSS